MLGLSPHAEMSVVAKVFTVVGNVFVGQGVLLILIQKSNLPNSNKAKHEQKHDVEWISHIITRRPPRSLQWSLCGVFQNQNPKVVSIRS